MGALTPPYTTLHKFINHNNLAAYEDETNV
jgi:hypothetical protein